MDPTENDDTIFDGVEEFRRLFASMTERRVRQHAQEHVLHHVVDLGPRRYAPRHEGPEARLELAISAAHVRGDHASAPGAQHDGPQQERAAPGFRASIVAEAALSERVRLVFVEDATAKRARSGASAAFNLGRPTPAGSPDMPWRTCTRCGSWMPGLRRRRPVAGGSACSRDREPRCAAFRGARPARTLATRELDHVLAAVFGLWDDVIPVDRLFAPEAQLALPLKGTEESCTAQIAELKPAADEEASAFLEEGVVDNKVSVRSYDCKSGAPQSRRTRRSRRKPFSVTSSVLPS